MIVSELKDFAEIEASLSKYQNIFIFGCGTCSTTCQAGGEKEVKKISQQLQEIGKKISGYFVVEAPCDQRQSQRALRENLSKINISEAILVAACGVGIQVIADLMEKPVFSGSNTLFLGKIENLRSFQKLCSLCSQCILNETAGICPETLCAKRLLNGPCGGSFNGKCEVDQNLDCAWVLIYNRLKKFKRLDLIYKIQPAKGSRVVREVSFK